jgi:small subunit ribosomal protein S1
MTWVSPAFREKEAEFEELLKGKKLKEQVLVEGSLIRGVVVEVQPRRVIVDVGYKAEGTIPIEEFPRDAEGKVLVKPGDEVDVFVERVIEEWGIVLLSKEKADRLRVWEELERVARDGGTIQGTVVGKLKGGYSVDLGGVRAFLPSSQVDLRTPQNPDEILGQKLEFRVIKLNRFRNNIVLSRRILLEEQREKARKELLNQLKVGDIVKGTVKNITDYGAFIDLGGIDGLLHITDMSWKRIDHPSKLVKIGDTVEVMVLSFDREKERVSLGLKQKTPDPWNDIEKRYSVGQEVEGTVANIVDYGAFVELEEGVEGLVHVSEMSWTQKHVQPQEILKIGDRVKVKIIQLDPSARRISLSIRETQPNPWKIVAQNYPPGTVIEGAITRVTDYGIFVEIWDGVEGLVHLNEISWLKDIKNPAERFKVGDKVRAVVESVEPDHQRVNLSMKKLQENPWEKLAKELPPGSKVTAKAVSKTDFGVFLEVRPYMEGLLHRSEAPNEDLNFIKVGDEIEVYILSIDPREQRISLTLRSPTPEEIAKAKPVPTELERQLREKVLKQTEE